MIRTLQKKFIVTAMIAITVLLLVMLGAVNAVNAWTTDREAQQLLNDLLVQAQRPDMPQLPQWDPSVIPGEDAEAPPAPPEQDSDFDGSAPPQKPEEREPRGFFMQAPTEDDRMSAVYFTARIRDGAVDTVNVERISSVSEAQARTLAGQVLASGQTEGTVDDFRFLSGETADRSTVYVFLENSNRRTAVVRVALLSGLAGLGGWLLMLLLVILLSKKAIRPIAANMEQQRQFVTDAGHELKTPLSIILANTEAMELLQGETKWSRNIKGQVHRLTDLTQNLLTLARAEEIPAQSALSAQPLSELTEQAVQMFREPMALKGLQFRSDVAPELQVMGSRPQLSSLLSILLDNAVKYTPEGGSVTLTLSGSEKQCVLRTQNEVEALPDCPPERLFDRFYRADAARTQQRAGGFGIGLSAASVIARQHKGTLEADYPDEAHVRFTVTLPAC